MKNFRFGLERVLHWRTSQVQLEQQKLQQLLQERNSVDAALAELSAARNAGRELLEPKLVPGSELNALAAYQLHLRKQEHLLLARRADCLRRLEEQRVSFLRARRAQRLLEMLRKKQLDDWKIALNREVEALAAEAYLAQWSAD